MKQPQTRKVRVVRAFYFRGEPVKKDAVIELPDVFAREMMAAGKAAAVAQKEPEPEKPEGSKGNDAKKEGGKDAR